MRARFSLLAARFARELQALKKRRALRELWKISQYHQSRSSKIENPSEVDLLQKALKALNYSIRTVNSVFLILRFSNKTKKRLILLKLTTQQASSALETRRLPI